MRIIDDALILVENSDAHLLINNARKRNRPGTIVDGLAEFLSFDLYVIQSTDMAVTIHGGDKLRAINCFPIDQNCLKQLDERLNAVKLQSFISVNNPIGWLGTNASLFCVFYSSWLQQKVFLPLVQDFID